MPTLDFMSRGGLPSTARYVAVRPALPAVFLLDHVFARSFQYMVFGRSMLDPCFYLPLLSQAKTGPHPRLPTEPPQLFKYTTIRNIRGVV